MRSGRHSSAGWISRSSKSNSAAESASYAPAAPAAEAAYEASAEEAAEAEAPAEKAGSSYDYEASSEAADDSYEEYEEAAEPAASNTTYAEKPADSSYDTAESEYSADESEMSDMTLAADKAQDLKASRDQSVAAGKKKTSDKYRQKEQSLTVKLDSLKEEDGKLICTMTVTDPGITKHKQDEVITAVINEPIKGKVSKFYAKSADSRKDTYVVVLLPTEPGFIVTDIRREL